MGIGAIAKPALVTAQFGILELTLTSRNEVRAVDRGFGVFMALALLAALRQPELRDCILFAVAAALGGMAAGRSDRCWDRPPGGRANGGRLTLAEQCRYAMQTVVAQPHTAPLNRRNCPTARQQLNQP